MCRHENPRPRRDHSLKPSQHSDPYGRDRGRRAPEPVPCSLTIFTMPLHIERREDNFIAGLEVESLQQQIEIPIELNRRQSCPLHRRNSFPPSAVLAPGPDANSSPQAPPSGRPSRFSVAYEPTSGKSLFSTELVLNIGLTSDCGNASSCHRLMQAPWSKPPAWLTRQIT